MGEKERMIKTDKAIGGKNWIDERERERTANGADIKARSNKRWDGVGSRKMCTSDMLGIIAWESREEPFSA